MPVKDADGTFQNIGECPVFISPHILQTGPYNSFWVNVPLSLHQCSLCAPSITGVHLSFQRNRNFKYQQSLVSIYKLQRLFCSNSILGLLLSLSPSPSSLFYVIKNNVLLGRKRGGVCVSDFGTGDPVFTFRGLPGLPQLLHSDVLVFPVQVAVFVGLLLLHVFYYKLGEERETELSVTKNI